MFIVINSKGLSFTLKAASTKDAYSKLMLMMGKRSVPAHINVVAA